MTLNSTKKVGIVVPCYNEANRLQLNAFSDFIRKFPDIRFCFVNDGSSDRTGAVLDELAKDFPGHAHALHFDVNKGKGEAVRHGVEHFMTNDSCELIGYWDADLSTPLDEIHSLINVFRSSRDAQFVCGSRVLMMGYRIERQWFRHYFGRGFATMISLFLRLPIYDTQCGAKLIRADLCRRIFDAPFASRWIFDVELIVRTILVLGYGAAFASIKEVPLKKWIHEKGSKLSLLTLFPIALELIGVFFKYHRFLGRAHGESRPVDDPEL